MLDYMIEGIIEGIISLAALYVVVFLIIKYSNKLADSLSPNYNFLKQAEKTDWNKLDVEPLAQTIIQLQNYHSSLIMIKNDGKLFYFCGIAGVVICVISIFLMLSLEPIIFLLPILMAVYHYKKQSRLLDARIKRVETVLQTSYGNFLERGYTAEQFNNYRNQLYAGHG